MIINYFEPNMYEWDCCISELINTTSIDKLLISIENPDKDLSKTFICLNDYWIDFKSNKITKEEEIFNVQPLYINWDRFMEREVFRLILKHHKNIPIINIKEDKLTITYNY